VSGFAKRLCRFGVLRILKHIGDDHGDSTHEILLAFSISGLLFFPVAEKGNFVRMQPGSSFSCSGSSVTVE
jgi:hypothetical protein